MAFDRAVSVGRLNGFSADLDAFVIKRDLLRPGVIRRQAGEQCCGSHSARGEPGQMLHENTTLQVAVLPFVKQVQQLLWIIGCLFSFHCLSLYGVEVEAERKATLSLCR